MKIGNIMKNTEHLSYKERYNELNKDKNTI